MPPGLDKSLESSPGLISRNPKFWERLIGIVPPSHERVYGALADGMEKYKELLEARAKGIEDTERLRQQNNELRMLLKQYMQSDVRCLLRRRAGKLTAIERCSGFHSGH